MGEIIGPKYQEHIPPFDLNKSAISVQYELIHLMRNRGLLGTKDENSAAIEYDKLYGRQVRAYLDADLPDQTLIALLKKKEYAKAAEHILASAPCFSVQN